MYMILKKNKKGIITAAMAAAIFLMLSAMTLFVSMHASSSNVSDSDAAECVSDSHITAKAIISSSDAEISKEFLAQYIGSLNISFTTSKDAGESMSMMVSPSPCYVDWGDGNSELCESELVFGTLQGHNVKIYSTQPVTKFSCNSNDLTALDVSRATSLVELSCSANQLTELNVSSNSALETLWCNGNKLTSLNVSSCHSLSTLYCMGNSLKFSTIKYFVVPSVFECNPQNTIEVPSEINAGQVIDLSSEFFVGGVETRYKWHEVGMATELVPTSAEEGKFTFGDDFSGKTICCDLTNSKFSTLTLQTGEVYIKDKSLIPQAVLVSENSYGSLVRLTAGPAPFYVDWGDGNKVECTTEYASGVLLGTTIKLYNSVSISKLYCNDLKLTSLDVSEAVGLIELNCYSNSIASLDVSKNTALKSLNCAYNSIGTLDVSKNTALTSLACTGCGLSSLNVRNNTALTDLRCYANNLTKLDVTNNSALQILYCNSNSLSSLDISHNPSLIILSCNKNKIGKLDISHNPALMMLYCSDNQLTSLNISNNASLNALSCENNQLSLVDVSSCSSIGQLICSNNNLKFSTIKTSSAPSYAMYGPQPEVKIAAKTMAGKTLDLSSECSVNGTDTVYKWYLAEEADDNEPDDFDSSSFEAAESDGTEVTPFSSDRGKFVFSSELIGKKLYCVMTNAEYPDLELVTTETEIIAYAPDPASEDAPSNGEGFMLIGIAYLLMLLSAANALFIIVRFRIKLRNY